MAKRRESSITGRHYRRTGGASRERIGGGLEAIPRTETDRIMRRIPARDPTPKKERDQQEAVATEILARHGRLEAFRALVEDLRLPIEVAGKIVGAARSQAYELRRQCDLGPDGREHEIMLMRDTLKALIERRLPTIADPFVPSVVRTLYWRLMVLYKKNADISLPEMRSLREYLKRQDEASSLKLLALHCRRPPPLKRPPLPPIDPKPTPKPLRRRGK